MVVNNFRVATFNTFGTTLFGSQFLKRYRYIAKAITDKNLDVIMLQEVHSYIALVILKRYLKQLPYCVYRPSIIGPTAGLVVFSRYPLAYKGYKSVRYKKIISRSIFSFLKYLFVDKGVLVAEIDQPNLYLLNVHLSANLDNDWSPESKFYIIHQTELAKLTNILKLYKSEKYVLGGDFNIDRTSDLYQTFVTRNLVIDPGIVIKGVTYHKEFLKVNQESHWIDYLISNNVRCCEIEVVFGGKYQALDQTFGYLSDHLGLMGVMQYS